MQLLDLCKLTLLELAVRRNSTVGRRGAVFIAGEQTEEEQGVATEAGLDRAAVGQTI